MTDKPEQETLLTFPCDFTLKVFGMTSPEFEATVFGIVNKLAPNVSDRGIQSRASENSKYTALSITVHVDSKQQLDQIYIELSSSPLVIMVL